MFRLAHMSIQAFLELVRYDLANRIWGCGVIYRQMRKYKVKAKVRGGALEVVAAVDWASSFYWRRVWCQQRSVAAARLMRRYGIPGEVVIGLRKEPFCGHAWVEVGGHVVNDSPEYARKLTIVDRL